MEDEEEEGVCAMISPGGVGCEGDDNGWLRVHEGEGSLISTSIIPQHGRRDLVLCVLVRTSLDFLFHHFWIGGMDSSNPQCLWGLAGIWFYEH